MKMVKIVFIVKLVIYKCFTQTIVCHGYTV